MNLRIKDVPMVDMVFPIEGKSIARQHAHDLQNALCTQLPWLSEDQFVGVHPLKLVHGLSDEAYLSARSRLLIRVPKSRTTELRQLEGVTLDVASHAVRLGAAHEKELVPHSTLYAYHVAAESHDEVLFMSQVNAELQTLGIGGERVCGKAHPLGLSERAIHAFSLMVHGLAPEQSLRLQQFGVGKHRMLGCGIFVAHKSAAAV